MGRNADFAAAESLDKPAQYLTQAELDRLEELSPKAGDDER
ncbi:hypothetical protein [Nonomuraea zeae]|nr:hypothetical protein [Nonomuraea zeae]